MRAVLTVRANGKSLGPLGPHGAVRDVEFKNGDFKLVPVQGETLAPACCVKLIRVNQQEIVYGESV